MGESEDGKVGGRGIATLKAPAPYSRPRRRGLLDGLENVPDGILDPHELVPVAALHRNGHELSTCSSTIQACEQILFTGKTNLKHE